MSWQQFLRVFHRYLGIALGIIFFLWFASGFVIIYTGGMPSLSTSERLQQQQALDLDAITLSPQRAASIAADSAPPRLMTIMGRPAYRFDGRRPLTIFADDGSVLSAAQVSSQRIAADFLGVSTELVERVATVTEVDQWTIGLRADLPLEKFRVLDDRGIEVYVSPIRAEVVLATTSTDRLLAWLGAIPHWLYFVELRRDTESWSRVVIWLSSLGAAMALVGLIMLYTQLRRVRPFNLSQAIPYKGIMRWHYWFGLVFGWITLGWVFSGLLSMEPYSWNRVGGMDIASSDMQIGEIDFAAFDSLQIRGSPLQNAIGSEPVMEIAFRQSLGRHYLELLRPAQESSWGFATEYLESDAPAGPWLYFRESELLERLDSLGGNYRVTDSNLLSQYDNYYYGRENSQGPAPPLPVLRVQFDDPLLSRYYVDLASGQLLDRSHRWDRIERWLYHGLHSLDFGFLYRTRPLWDMVVLLLLAGGLVLTTIGLVLGLRRLQLDVRRMRSG